LERRNFRDVEYVMDAERAGLRTDLGKVIDREVSERMSGGGAAAGEKKDGAPSAQSR
jgi:hypothetical protein